MDNVEMILFKEKKVRKIFYKKEWWFVINDVIEALTGSVDPAQYFKRMKQRNVELFRVATRGKGKFGPPIKIAFDTQRGRRKMYCWNASGILRLIQSIPSSKAEPFRIWLATIGYERMQEIEDPELATKRTRLLYKAKGYSDDWVRKRMQGIAVREELTDEWQKRGIRSDKDYKALTKAMSKAIFGMTPKQYKKLKGVKKQNLRDYMNDLELIFTMLGERSAIEIHRNENSRSLKKLKKEVKDGGEISRSAKNKLEKKLKHPIVTKNSFLPERKKLK